MGEDSTYNRRQYTLVNLQSMLIKRNFVPKTKRFTNNVYLQRATSVRSSGWCIYPLRSIRRASADPTSTYTSNP